MLSEFGAEAKQLAGGQSLIPLMKLRLRIQAILWIWILSGTSYIKEENGTSVLERWLGTLKSRLRPQPLPAPDAKAPPTPAPETPGTNPGKPDDTNKKADGLNLAWRGRSGTPRRQHSERSRHHQNLQESPRRKPGRSRHDRHRHPWSPRLGSLESTEVLI